LHAVWSQQRAVLYKFTGRYRCDSCTRMALMAHTYHKHMTLCEHSVWCIEHDVQLRRLQAPFTHECETRLTPHTHQILVVCSICGCSKCLRSSTSHAQLTLLTWAQQTALQQRCCPCMQCTAAPPQPCQPLDPSSPSSNPPPRSDDLGLAAQPVHQLLGTAHHDAALALDGLLDTHNLAGGRGQTSGDDCCELACTQGPGLQGLSCHEPDVGKTHAPTHARSMLLTASGTCPAAEAKHTDSTDAGGPFFTQKRSLCPSAWPLHQCITQLAGPAPHPTTCPSPHHLPLAPPPDPRPSPPAVVAPRPPPAAQV
jgi:hypothetical protein